ncbi:hypothetical protein ACLB2K_050539 [Fragaria x ananassa]
METENDDVSSWSFDTNWSVAGGALVDRVTFKSSLSPIDGDAPNSTARSSLILHQILDLARPPLISHKTTQDRGSGEEATTVQDGGGVGGLDSQAGMDERVPLVAPSTSENEAGEGGNAMEENSRDSAYQRYDIQQVARWIEQVLPFLLLLLVVFIRQHLQGTSFVTSFLHNFHDLGLV